MARLQLLSTKCYRIYPPARALRSGGAAFRALSA